MSIEQKDYDRLEELVRGISQEIPDQKMLKCEPLYTSAGWYVFVSYCYHTKKNQFGVILVKINKKNETNIISFGLNETAITDMHKYMASLKKETITTLFGDKCETN